MTPLRNFVHRIARRRPAEAPRTEAPAAEQPRGRQRPARKPSTGRSETAPAAQPASRDRRQGARKPAEGKRTPAANGKNGGTESRAYQWGRRVGDDETARREAEQRRNAQGRRRRGFRPSRGSLDQPLPEDIAFRSADEGGDRTILPMRRRRPKGLRTTERVIFGGARFLGFVRKPMDSSNGTPQEQTTQSELDDVEAAYDLGEPDSAEEADLTDVADVIAADADRLAVAELATRSAGEREEQGEAASPARPRRRGRRGGRRRRVAAVEDAPVAGEGDEAEDDGAEPQPSPAIEVAEQAARIPAERYPEAFRALGIQDRSLALMAAFGYERPTPIQEQAIPALLEGKDVVGLAQTGSGKTVAFGVPMVERLDAGTREVQAVVMVPTRELAQQVLDVLSALGKPYGLTAIGLLGGRALRRDFEALQAKPHIVVGTPGRVIDHLQRGTLSLRHVVYGVLDEADQMLDIGFLPDIRRILAHTPRRRQTALFSATMPSTIKRLVWQFMRDPETLSVDAELSTVESTEQVYMEVAQRDKVKGLRELIERELKGRTLVFCRMKRGVDRVAEQLQRQGVRVGALHGDMDQRKRDSVVEAFRKGQLDILIATNVAARGLDIPEITHVVNFDAPQNAEEYVHRIGRTGRAGREGKAITFICEHDLAELDMLLQEFGEVIKRERLEIYA